MATEKVETVAHISLNLSTLNHLFDEANGGRCAETNLLILTTSSTASKFGYPHNSKN